jgi:hypothetical protein
LYGNWPFSKLIPRCKVNKVEQSLKFLILFFPYACLDKIVYVYISKWTYCFLVLPLGSLAQNRF